MTITIYTKKNCMPCKAMKKWLDKEGLVYTEVSAEENVEALLKMGMQSAPVVLVKEDGKVVGSWSGFRPDVAKKLIAA